MNLDDWIAQLKNANSQEELYTVLDNFRTLAWTDEQRALVSRLYIRLLENILASPASVPLSQEKVVATKFDSEEPVWYERH